MRICIIGGGAAGMFAAVKCAEGGAETLLLEKNEKLGKKLYITGKGRCNLTNECPPVEFLANVVNGERFLRTAAYTFPAAKTMEFFENAGLPLVTERGNRVFPKSQKASDVIKTLTLLLKRYGAEVRLGTPALGIRRAEEGGFIVETPAGGEKCDKVMVATGGRSYPSTGSTGDGYLFAATLGIRTVPPAPALAPIPTVQNMSALEGLSLKNVALSAYDKRGVKLADEFGELLFTKRGLSGPIALTVSSFINRSERVSLSLDLKPALDAAMLDARVLRDFDGRKNQALSNVTRALMPDRLNLYVLAAAGLDPGKKVNSVTKEERARLVAAVKGLSFSAAGSAPFEEAVVTAGGVSTDELTPQCESRAVKGLYFIGETVDVDALTGGFNLQIAFSTAACAAADALAAPVG